MVFRGLTFKVVHSSGYKSDSLLCLFVFIWGDAILSLCSKVNPGILGKPYGILGIELGMGTCSPYPQCFCSGP